MAELQRKKEKVDKEKNSVKVLEDILEDVTSKSTQSTQIDKPIIDPKNLKKPSVRPQEVTIPKPQSVSLEPTVPPTETISLSQLQPGTVHPKVKPILPSWVTKPWRWMIPEDPQLKQQWLTTWGEFLVAFSRVLNLHILDIQEVSVVYPFLNPVLHKKLSIIQLKSISDYLIEQKKASWWDTEKSRLRVYWKTLASFAEEIFEYSFQHGYEMITAYDLVKMSQSWSTLPSKDLTLIMKLLVESEKASWADTERKTIEFYFT